MKRTSLFAWAALSVLGLAPLSAQAQTVITGHHDNMPTPPGDSNGYDATGGSFVVPADTGSALDATFDHDLNGLFVSGSTATAVVYGGTFSNNAYGLTCSSGGAATVNGGAFIGNSVDLLAYDGGGNLSIIDLFGSFKNPATGQPLTPGQTVVFSGGAVGSFTGTLANNTVAQTYTYTCYNGRITLHDIAAAPEPSQFAALAVGALGLGARTLRMRKRSAA